MKVVWSARLGPPTSKLVLLALADWASDDGSRLHPSLQAIADKVGVSRSQAQRIVRGFIDDGLLSVVANQFGGAPGCTPQYRLHLDRLEALATDSTRAAPTDRIHATPTDSADATPTDSTDATGSAGATGSTDAQNGSHGCGRRVAPMRQTGSTGATQTVIEPLDRREIESAQARAAAQDPTAADLLPPPEQTTPRPARKCPVGFEVTPELRSWAAKGHPGVDLEFETAKFRDHTFATARSDWPATWRNWIRKAAERFGPGATPRQSAVERQISTMNALTGRSPSHSRSAADDRDGYGFIDVEARHVP